MNKERLLLLLYPAGVPYRKPSPDNSDGSDGSDEESNNHEWHVSFADGTTMNCTVEKTDEEFDFTMNSHGDLNLFCDLTNYIDNTSIGKTVHKSRIEIENLFSSISDEKTNNLYRCLADMGIGRDLFAIFKKN